MNTAVARLSASDYERQNRLRDVQDDCELRIQLQDVRKDM